MRKIAIFLVILLIVITALVTIASIEALTATNLGVTSTIVGATGAVTAPMVAWIKDSWLFVGTNFAYIAATTLAISVVGGLFMVFIVYNLVWKKAIQQWMLKKQPSAQGSVYDGVGSSTTISISPAVSTAPVSKPKEPAKAEVKEEAAT